MFYLYLLRKLNDVRARNINSKTSLCLITRRDKKLHGRVKGKFPRIFNLATRIEFPAIRSCRLSARKISPGTHWLHGWVRAASVLGTLKNRKKKLFPYRQSNPDFPAFQPWPSHYSHDATPTLKPESPKIMTVPIYVFPFIYSEIRPSLNFCFARTTVWIIRILKGQRSSRKKPYFLKLSLTGRWIWTGPLGRDAE